MQPVSDSELNLKFKMWAFRHFPCFFFPQQKCFPVMSGGYIMRGDTFAYLSSQWIFIFCIKKEKLLCFKAQTVATRPLSFQRLIYTLIALLSSAGPRINTVNSAQLWALIAYSQNQTHSIFLFCSFFSLPTLWCISKHSVACICIGFKENSSKL